MIELVALLSLFAAAVSEETAVRRRGDGAGVLVTDGRRVFLLRRSRKVHEPGTWGIPGGGIGPGEVPLLAAMREVEEEVGELPAGRLLAGRVTLPIPGSDGERSFTTFAWLTTPDRLDAWVPELNWEHDDYAVVELERATSMDLHPGLRDLFHDPRIEAGIRRRVSTGEWPTRLDMDQLAASMNDQMGEEVAEAERELPNFSFREDFDADEFFSRWAAQEPRLEYLGSGVDRAVFRTDRGVLKIGYGGGGIDQNLSEALVWKEAPDELRPHLVPVLDAASDGEWILAEYAEVSNEDLPYDLVTAVWGFGLEDLVPGNASKDGRLLDYGTVNWDKWVKIVPDTDAFR